MLRIIKRFFRRENAPVLSAQMERAEHSTSTLVLRGAAPCAVTEYDSALLERSRLQWQFGDWEALVKIELNELLDHPDRAQLALLAASAHQHMNNSSAASEFTGLAQRWGCTKGEIASVLLSDAYNTLGRIAAIHQAPHRATNFFVRATKLGSPDGDIRLLTEARMQQELKALTVPLVENVARLIARQLSDSPHHPEKVQPLLTSPKIVTPTLTGEKIQPTLAGQATIVEDLRTHVKSAVKHEMANVAHQLEAFLAVQSYLQTGDLMPQMHGWAISADFAQYLIDLIRENDYDLIVEFGSGTSTAIIARTLEHKAKADGTQTVQVTFEHLKQYFNQTHSLLTRNHVADRVRLVHADLVEETNLSDGNTFSFYDCRGELAKQAEAFAGGREPRLLVVVDGPPALTCKHARYPALPLVLDAFPSSHIDTLMDDYNRSDEKIIVEMWRNLLEKSDRDHEHTELVFEKGASFLSIKATTL